MLRSILVLGLAAAIYAQESSYTGPMFNPSEAPYFAQTGLVIPTQSDLPAIQPTDSFSAATTISGIILPSSTLSRSSSATASSSSSQSASSSASSSASRTATSTVSSAATSASSLAPAQQSTGAAVANRIGVAGAVAGGLLAGLALA